MKKLRVRWKETSLEAFIERHGGEIDAHQAFLQTGHPLEPGTVVRFELLLAEGDAFLAGTGTIEAVAERDRPPGMVLRFDELTAASEPFLARVRDDGAPTREVTTGEIAWPGEDQDLLEGEGAEDTFPDAQPAGFRGRGRTE